MKRLLLVIGLLSLSGCIRRGVVITPPVIKPVVTAEERARLHDVSFPLGVDPCKIRFDEQVVLTYNSPQSLNELIVFYKRDMECLGWKERLVIEADESMLLFEKPSKMCVIVLRKGSEVTLWISPKK